MEIAGNRWNCFQVGQTPSSAPRGAAGHCKADLSTGSQAVELLMTAGSSLGIKCVSPGPRPSRIPQPQGRQAEKAISSLCSSLWMTGLALGHPLAPWQLWNLEVRELWQRDRCLLTLCLSWDYTVSPTASCKRLCRSLLFYVCPVSNMETVLPKLVDHLLAQGLALFPWLSKPLFCKQLHFLWMSSVLGRLISVAGAAVWFLSLQSLQQWPSKMTETACAKRGAVSKLSMLQKWHSRCSIFRDYM